MEINTFFNDVTTEKLMIMKQAFIASDYLLFSLKKSSYYEEMENWIPGLQEILPITITQKEVILYLFYSISVYTLF